MKKTKIKEINFYVRYNYDPEKEAKKRTLKRAIIPVGSAVLTILLVFVIFGGISLFKILKINSMEKYISDPTNIRHYEEAKQYTDERDALAAQRAELETARTTINTSFQLSDDIFADIKGNLKGAFFRKCAFDAASGVVIIDIETPSVTDMPKIVKGLKGMNRFSAVKYTGYDSSSTTYHATITCTMKNIK